MSAGDDPLEVYLVRHAFAAHADPVRWPDDAERPLTGDGSTRFRNVARGLSRIVPTVDSMLSSGYARAWQTAQLLNEVAGWPTPEECRALEAGRPLSTALDVLRGRSERSLALVGHEPDLSRLASVLCTGSADALQLVLKKGAVVSLSFDGPVEPAQARLRWAAPPRILRGLVKGPTD